MTPDEDRAQASAYAKEVKATFPVVQDPEFTIFEKFGVEPVPANVIVDRKGRVVASVEGADIAKIDAAVAKALAAK